MHDATNNTPSSNGYIISFGGSSPSRGAIQAHESFTELKIIAIKMICPYHELSVELIEPLKVPFPHHSGKQKSGAFFVMGGQVLEKTAILIDGGFFVKRYRALYSCYTTETPKKIARNMVSGCLANLRKANKHCSKHDLYRILYYDCPPLEKRLQNPVTGAGISMGNTDEAKFRNAFFCELKKMRRVAVRMGRLSGEHGKWMLKPEISKALLKGTKDLSSLTGDDVFYDVRQKGVDMKIGLDIASLVYKKLVTQIILVAGDSDFVPAAKLARREGIDFILDPMWNSINPDLHEHIDGLISSWTRPPRR